MTFDVSVTIALFSCHQEIFKNSLRSQLAMAKRANQTTYYFHYWLNLTEMSPKNNSQTIGRCNMHIPMKNVKCQNLSKRTFWQHTVLGKWNICTLEIAISDIDEYVLAYRQLDSVYWDWFDKQLVQSPHRIADRVQLVQGPAVGPLGVNTPWPTRPSPWLATVWSSSSIPSSVSVGCDLISRVLEHGGLKLPA